MSTTITTSKDVLYSRVKQNTISADTTLAANQSGEEFNVATDALTITLPQISSENIGMEFLVRNTGADANNIITLSPASTDGINGTIANAAADSVASGAVDKDWVNTKSTSNKGDFVKLRAVSTTAWYIIDGVGIWASEA
tara:strand:+ start:144 stop:563 length:420 start_codon:yes stop_codon:yes gene_type:complete